VRHDDHDGETPDDDDRGAPIDGRARTWDVAAHVIAAVVLVTYAWWVVALEPFSAQATAAVLLTGAAAIAIGTGERWQARRAPPAVVGDGSGIAKWVALATIACAWELASYLQHPRADHPTVSSLADYVLDTQVARATAFVIWVAAARGLARR
jgi:hypothetical protein